MNSGLRRFLIFIIMVGTGTVLILYNLPLLFIIALTAAFGFLLLVLLSPPTAAELKSSILNIYKISFIRRQKASKPFIKRTEQKAPETQKTVELRVEPFQIPADEGTRQKRKFSLRPGSLVASVRSLGTILRTGKLPDRDNAEETDGIANKTGGEKASGSALARAAEFSQDSMTANRREFGGAGGSSPRVGVSPSPTDDPFLSLSGDELETGLLDTLEEEDTKRTEIRPDSSPPDLSLPYIPGSSGVTIGESDIPIPPQEISADTQEEASSVEPNLDEFNGLEGTDSIDQNLNELDTIDLDSVSPEGDMWEEEDTSQTSLPPKPPEAAIPLPEPQARKEPTPPANPPPVVSRVSLPKDDQADMTVFTAPVSADDRMISSLADIIKTTKKTKDISLLRELKDFKVPAKDIEKELSELYEGLNTVSDRKGKTKPS
jgi:hypothetical protein